MDCIDLAEDRNKWSVLQNAAMNLEFHKKLGSS
jgi:hypothetical protein